VISIPQPIPDKYRLDLLLVPRIDPRTGKLKAGFETVAQCVVEDRGRGRSMREIAAGIRVISSGMIWPPLAVRLGRRGLSPERSPQRASNIDPEAARNFAGRLEAAAYTECPPPNAGTVFVLLDQRRQFGGRLLDLKINGYPRLTDTETRSNSTPPFVQQRR